MPRDPYTMGLDTIAERIRREFGLRIASCTRDEVTKGSVIRREMAAAELQIHEYEPFSRPWRQCFRVMVLGEFRAWWADVRRQTVASEVVFNSDHFLITGHVS